MAKTPKRQAPKPAQKPSAPADNSPIGHNLDAVQEAERVQLISFLSKARIQIGKVEAKKAELKVETDELTEVFRYAKAAGFARKDLESYLLDMSARGRNLVEEEERRARHREWLGLPTHRDMTQMNLFGDDSPAEVRDEAHWKSDGYRAGLRGDDCRAPKECPERFVQAWVGAWHKGQAELAQALNKVKETPALPPAAPAPEAEEDDENDGFDADAAADRLRAEGFLEHETPAGHGDEKEPAEFEEATPEELEAQTERRLLQERRDAGEEEPVG